MTLSIQSSFLPHVDPEASLHFYRDLLGFELRLDVGYEGMRWLTFGSPEQPDTSVVLAPPTVDPSTSEEERRVVREMMAKGNFAMVVLTTPDLETVFARLVEAGVPVIQEPTDQPYGLRDCAVRDPAGNVVRINQSH